MVVQAAARHERTYDPADVGHTSKLAVDAVQPLSTHPVIGALAADPGRPSMT